MVTWAQPIIPGSTLVLQGILLTQFHAETCQIKILLPDRSLIYFILKLFLLICITPSSWVRQYLSLLKMHIIISTKEVASPLRVIFEVHGHDPVL